MERSNKMSEYNEWLPVAIKNNINKYTYRSRVRRGWSCERAATTPTRKKRKDREYIKKAKENGISYVTYTYRVDEMLWSPEEASTIPPMSVKEKMKEAQRLQTEYKEITDRQLYEDPNNLYSITKYHLEEAERNGISPGTVKSRVYKLGWLLSDAIKQPVKKPDFLNIPEYNKYLKVAKEKGINRETYYSRVMKLGWTPKDAAEKTVVSRNSITRPDERWIKKAKENGIKYKTYINRVDNLNWPPEKAATIKPLGPDEFLNEDTKRLSREGFERFRGV